MSIGTIGLHPDVLVLHSIGVPASCLLGSHQEISKPAASIFNSPICWRSLFYFSSLTRVSCLASSGDHGKTKKMYQAINITNTKKKNRKLSRIPCKSHQGWSRTLRDSFKRLGLWHTSSQACKIHFTMQEAVRQSGVQTMSSILECCMLT